MATLIFQNTSFTVITRDGQPWLQAAEIARALGLPAAIASAAFMSATRANLPLR